MADADNVEALEAFYLELRQFLRDSGHTPRLVGMVLVTMMAEHVGDNFLGNDKGVEAIIKELRRMIELRRKERPL